MAYFIFVVETHSTYKVRILLLLGQRWGVELLVVLSGCVCPHLPLYSLCFFIPLFHSQIGFFPSHCSQGWRISITVELTGSVVSIGQRRGSTVAALTCICIAEPQPGNTRSILMTSPTPILPSLHPSVCCWNKHSLSLREKRAGTSKRTRASSEEEGLLASEWRGRELQGRGVSWQCLQARTGTHRKRRGEEREYCCALLGLLSCAALLFSFAFRSRSSHAVLSLAFLDFSHLRWVWGTLWTGKGAAGTGVEYITN